MSLKNDHLSVTPPSAGRLVAGLVALVAVAVICAAQLPYSKKEYVPGYLQSRGGDMRVVAPARGIVSYEVGLGGTVTAGQPFATIRTAEILSGGHSVLDAQREVLSGKRASLQSELSGAGQALQGRAQALALQRLLAKETVRQAEVEVSMRRQYVAMEELKLARQQGLRAQGFVSAVAFEQAQTDLLARRADLQAAERAVTQANAQGASLDADQASNLAQISSQKGQLQRELSSLDQSATDAMRQAQVSLSAQRAATIVALAAGPGDTVEAGQLLAKLAPHGVPLDALLLLPAAAAGRVKPGQTVLLQMTAYPYQTYGLVEAEILQLEDAPLLVDETTLRSSGVPNGTLVVKATARLKDIPARIGGTAALRSGMQFSAAVEVERKSFLAWMTWPLLKHFL